MRDPNSNNPYWLSISLVLLVLAILGPILSSASLANKDNGLFESLLEKVGEIQLAGTCKRSVRPTLGNSEDLRDSINVLAPPLSLVLGKKRPFWRETKGHVLIKSFNLTIHATVIKNKFMIREEGTEGAELTFLGTFDDKNSIVTVKSLKRKSIGENNKAALTDHCTYFYQGG